MKLFLLTACFLILGTHNNHAQETWTLKACIDYAIAHSFKVKQQEILRQQRKNDLNSAQWSRVPNLSGSSSQSFNFGRSLQADNTYKSANTQSVGFNLSTSIPLFTGMQIPNNIALSKLNLLAATEDLNKAKEDIGIQVTSNYLQALLCKELAEVAHQQVELSKELLKQKEGFFKHGKASESEWQEAKARVAQDELSAVQADNNYQLALLDLSQLLELPSPEGFHILPPSDINSPADSLPALPHIIYDQAVMNNPAIKAAQYRLQGAKRSIRIAQSAYYPQLSLGAGLGTNYYKVSHLENSNFSSQLRDNFSQFIGFTLNVPLFNRLETRNRVRNAKLDHEAINCQLEESKKALYKEIQQAYYNAVAAKSKYISSQIARSASEATFNLIKGKYMNEKANSTEYNEARINLMKAISECIQSKYDYLLRNKILDFYTGVPIDL